MRWEIIVDNVLWLGEGGGGGRMLQYDQYIIIKET